MKNGLLLLIFITLVSCGDGAQNNQQKNSISKNVSLNRSSGDEDPIQQVDLYGLNYDYGTNLSKPRIKTDPVCSSDNSLCVGIASTPIATYSLGQDRSNHWIIKDYLATITINFNSNISPDFKITDIYNDYSTAGRAIGEISELDTSNCDQLVSSGRTAGLSCKINFAYSGDVFSSDNSENIIHFIFGWGNSQVLDFNFPVKNSYATNQNVAIMGLNSDQPVSIINALPQDLNTNIDYNKNSNMDVMVQNYGSSVLKGSNGAPTISVRLGTSFDYNLTNLYYNDALQTTCEDKDVGITASCFFPFSFVPNLAGQTIQSEIGRMLFQYSNGQQPVNYTNRFILSIGELRYSGKQQVTDWNANHIYIEKPNIGNNYLAYSSGIESLSFSLISDPKFDLEAISVGSKDVYAYGTYNSKSSDDLLKAVSFNFDPGCFNGFDIGEDNNDLEGRNCPVSVVFNDDISLLTAKPLSGILKAKYYSSVEQRWVEQILGVVVIYYGGKQTPKGNYLTNCTQVSYQNGVLSAQCPDGDGNLKQSSLNYDELCQAGSTVHNVYSNLLCDQYNFIDYNHPSQVSFISITPETPAISGLSQYRIIGTIYGSNSQYFDKHYLLLPQQKLTFIGANASLSSIVNSGLNLSSDDQGISLYTKYQYVNWNNQTSRLEVSIPNVSSFSFNPNLCSDNSGLNYSVATKLPMCDIYRSDLPSLASIIKNLPSGRCSLLDAGYTYTIGCFSDDWNSIKVSTTPFCNPRTQVFDGCDGVNSDGSLENCHCINHL